MSEITLGGHTYILEAIEDTEAQAHDYDATLDVSADSSVEELDQWFEKVEAEWESLPKEIQEKITDKMMELADRLAEKTEGNSDVLPVDEATDSQGNEIFDHASGLKRFLSLDKEGIEYSFDDITKAIDAAENIARSGNRAPKLGYYWDEYWALLDAIKIRKQKGETFNLKPWALSAK
jgi:L-lactate utilization protein LutC